MRHECGNELTGAPGDPSRAVDYILFLTADVTVTPNLNEIRDHKYVDKAELQAMFKDPGESWSLSPCC